MLKGKLAILCLVAISLLVMNGTASAGIIDPCVSYWQLILAAPAPATGYCPLFACPQGDTDSFLTQGWSITVCVLDINGAPIPNVPAQDFWLIDCDPSNDAFLCGGSASSGADSLTNSAGMTTMTNGSIAAGGCGYGMALVVQGFTVLDSVTNCATEFCCPIALVSPDLNGDLLVDVVDLSLFAFEFPPNTPSFPNCADYNQDNLVDVVDLSLFAFHFGPPGHFC
jgi:hypothetical protein